MQRLLFGSQAIADEENRIALRIHGASASEKLKARLSSTSGMHHLLHGASLPDCSVLHRTSGVARKFLHSELLSNGSHSVMRAASSLVGEQLSRYVVGVEQQVAIRKRAAIKIQAVYRGFTSRVWYGKATKNAVMLQAAFRGWRTRKSYLELRSAALGMQRWYRAGRLRRRFLMSRSCSTIIQAHARGFLVRRMVRSWNSSAGLIQKRWRLYQGVRDTAAGKLQAAFRRMRVRREFLKAVRSASRIQAAYRRWRTRKSYVKLYAAAQRIERWWRARKKHRSSTVIQAYARGYLVRRMFSRWKLAASMIQRSWRLHQATKRVAAATFIQAQARGFIARRMVRKWNSSACVIQQRWRLHQVRHQAATRVQAFCRKVLVRKRFLTARGSAVKIQAAFGGWLVRRRMKEEKKLATVILAHVRRLLVTKRLKDWNLAAYLIQQAWKKQRRVAVARTAKISAMVIQAYARGFLVRQRLRRCHLAACTIQRHWRTHLNAKVTKQDGPVSPTEDWNSIDVEHLDECLDTCLGTLGGRQSPGLELPELERHSRSVDLQDDLSGYKLSLLKENQLQQVARVFLLRHHIAVEQQRARHAPPFPPGYKNYTDNNCNYYSSNTSLLQQQQQSATTAVLTPPGSTGDVILDVHYLLEEVRRGRRTDVSSSLVYMRNESFIHVEDNTCIQGETSLRRHQQEFAGLNVLLVVFVAVVVYTRTICQEVFVWATTKK